jgi:CheY-like chemotaxis protein
VGATVLVAEDEGSVRAVACTVLRREGYHVLEAESSADACKLFEEHGPSVDLLLTDVIMPGMNGPALAQRLVAMKPRLRVLFMSGYADSIDLTKTGSASVSFLSKPFRNAALVRMVDQLLHSGRDVSPN